MDIKTLKRLQDIKKEHGLNDNLIMLIFHLGSNKIDTFRDMIEKGIVPENTRCFRDLSPRLRLFVDTWRDGGPITVTHKAQLTNKGSFIYKKLTLIN